MMLEDMTEEQIERMCRPSLWERIKQCRGVIIVLGYIGAVLAIATIIAFIGCTGPDRIDRALDEAQQNLDLQLMNKGD